MSGSPLHTRLSEYTTKNHTCFFVFNPGNSNLAVILIGFPFDLFDKCDVGMRNCGNGVHEEVSIGRLV